MDGCGELTVKKQACRQDASWNFVHEFRISQDPEILTAADSIPWHHECVGFVAYSIFLFASI